MAEPTSSAPSTQSNATPSPSPSGGASSGGDSSEFSGGASGAAAGGGFTEPIDLGTREWSRQHFAKLYAGDEPATDTQTDKGGSGKDKAKGAAAKVQSGPTETPSAKSAKLPPATIDSEPDADAAQRAEAQAVAEELADGGEVSIAKLEKLARDGKFEEILKHLKVDPNGIRIPSSRFAEFRVKERELRRREDQVKVDHIARDREFSNRLDAVQKTYGKFAEAQKLIDSGDVLGGIEAAFGSFDAISEAALKQKLAIDPEVEKLKHRERQRERAEREQAEQRQREAAAQSETAEVNRYLGQVKAELGTSDNAIVQACCDDPEFVSAVYRAQKHEYQTTKKLIDIHEAAEKVLDVVKQAHAKWATRFGSARADNPESSDQAAIEPENTGGRGTEPGNGRNVRNRTVRQRAPVEAPAAVSDDDSLARWKRQMQAAVEKDRASRG